MQYSATFGINLGCDMYFDNETIRNQFKRLFQLPLFKTEYTAHDPEIIVDNPRTHSAKESGLNDFGKNTGTIGRTRINDPLSVLLTALEFFIRLGSSFFLKFTVSGSIILDISFGYLQYR